MGGTVRIASPSVPVGVDAVEQAVLGVGDGEIDARQFRPVAEIYKAAIRGFAAANVSHPAIPEIETAREPLLAGRRWGLGLLLRFGRSGFGGLRLLLRFRG